VAEEIVGILLAAGAGSRFGGDKLLHPLAGGIPIGVAAAKNLHLACERTVAVVRPDDLELIRELAIAGCEIVPCAEAKEGMGHSLAAGVRATAQASAWIVALGDMPYIHGTTYQAVAACLREGAALVATQYRTRRGHPVGFSNAWYPQLSSLSGDRGGGTLLEQYPSKLSLCKVEDLGVTQDIDYPWDVAAH
jgi:molybdenum cofactor cytidylyltransferase